MFTTNNNSQTRIGVCNMSLNSNMTNKKITSVLFLPICMCGTSISSSGINKYFWLNGYSESDIQISNNATYVIRSIPDVTNDPGSGSHISCNISFYGIK